MSERRRHVDTQEVLNRTGSWIALILAVLTAFMAICLVFVPIPEANESALNLLMGNIIALDGIVVSFFFGSSSKEKKQADTIDTLAQTARTAGASLAQPDAMVIPPGTSATATATAAGTVITPDKEST